jgi:dTDP-4-dehydrorhamnose 3,5-epimerase-like enzyme
MITDVTQDIAKKVTTYDSKGGINGWLMEMFKDGDKTAVYLSAAAPGAFKGYHLHRVRAARYVCLKGTMKIILYLNGKREEYILTPGKKLFIPKEVATGLQNIGDEEAWLVNFPDPAYDPNLKDEQVEYTQEELEQGVVK